MKYFFFLKKGQVKNGKIDWKDIIKVEKKKFRKDDEEIEIERRIFPHCVLYSNTTAGMTQFVFSWELDKKFRLSAYLRLKHPNRRFLLLLDNATSPRSSKTYSNLEIQFFPAQTSRYLQSGFIYG